MADKKPKGAQSGMEKTVRKTQTGKGTKNPTPNPKKGGPRNT